MDTTIYGLECPEIGQIRYVGKSCQPEKRLYMHIYSANSAGFHSQRWIAKLKKNGLKPRMVVLEVVPDGGDWAAAEIKWIEHGIFMGWPLTNTAKGGGGGSPINDAARLARKESMSRPEARKRMSDSAKARWADPEKRKRGLEGLKSEDRRKRASESARKRATPEYKSMMSARSKAAWSDPDKRSRIVSGITEETRASVSAASKAMWTRAEDGKKNQMLSNLRSRKKM